MSRLEAVVFDLDDTLYPEADYVLSGFQAVADWAEVHLGIADLSSLLMGTVAFNSLYNYGRARVSDPAYVDILTRAFAVQQEPVCMTPF